MTIFAHVRAHCCQRSASPTLAMREIQSVFPHTLQAAWYVASVEALRVLEQQGKEAFHRCASSNNHAHILYVSHNLRKFPLTQKKTARWGKSNRAVLGQQQSCNRAVASCPKFDRTSRLPAGNGPFDETWATPTLAPQTVRRTH